MQRLHEEIMKKRSQIVEGIQNAEHFLHDHRSKLTAPQAEEMERRVAELREDYDALIGLSHEKLAALRDMLAQLELNQRDRVGKQFGSKPAKPCNG